MHRKFSLQFFESLGCIALGIYSQNSAKDKEPEE